MSAQALMEHAVALRDAYEGAVQRGDMDAVNAIAPSFTEAIGALAEMGIGVPTGDGKGTYGPAEGESGDVSVGQESDGSTGVTATQSTGVAPSTAPSNSLDLGINIGQAPAPPTMSQAESAAALRGGASKAGASTDGDGDNEMESANNAFYSTDAATPGIKGAADSAREAMGAREAQIAQNEDKISALEQMNIESARDNSQFSAIAEAAAARDSQNQASSNARGASELSAGHTMSDDGSSETGPSANAFTDGPSEGPGGNGPGTGFSDGQSDGQGVGADSGPSFGGTSTGNGFTEAQGAMPGAYSNEMESANSAFADAATTGVGDESGNAFASVSEGRSNALSGMEAAAFAPSGEQLNPDGSFIDGTFGVETAKDGEATGAFSAADRSSESTSQGQSAQSNSNSTPSFSGNAFSGNAQSQSTGAQVAGFTERGDGGIWGDSGFGNAFGSWGESSYGSAAFGDSGLGAWGGGWGSEAFGGYNDGGAPGDGGGGTW